MNVRRIESLVWKLIYGGLLGLVLGWFMQERSAALANVLMSGGAVAVTLGAVLIFVRSRMKADD